VLHGRAADLSDIRRLLADARIGRSAIQVIVGEAGSGKTALLDRGAEDTGELGVVLAAAKRIGLGLADFEAAELAWLVKAKAELGWSPKYPAYRDGVAAIDKYTHPSNGAAVTNER
jgi:hypothetical protein